MFPNNFTVYLHDTNHREYFDKTNRSLSSGCVRVQNPLELTEYLLDDKKNWSLEKIIETLKREKTQNAKIKKKLPFTSYIGQHGVMAIVYNSGLISTP